MPPMSMDNDVEANPGAKLSDLLSAEAIWIGADAPNWRAAVRAAGDRLVLSGATRDAYTDEMIAAVDELGPYMVIAPGIALAHSRPSPAVLRAGVSVVTLSHPVPFGHRQNDPVRLVVGLAAPDEEGHVTALSTLAEFLADSTRLEALIGAGSPDEVQDMVRSFEKEQTAERTESTTH